MMVILVVEPQAQTQTISQNCYSALDGALYTAKTINAGPSVQDQGEGEAEAEAEAEGEGEGEGEDIKVVLI